jgi:hypothetical protein
VLDDAWTVGAVCEVEVEDLRVLLGLLESICGQAVLAFCLDDGERAVAEV